MLYRPLQTDKSFCSPDTTNWTPPAVLAALVEAYDVLAITTGRVGPRGLKAFWPEYRTELADLADLTEPSDVHRRSASRRPTSVQIARMEMVLLGWRNAAGEYPG